MRHLAWRTIVGHDPCVYCAVWPNWQRDHDAMTAEHVTPISQGGRRTSWENIVGAHRSCNHDRGDMPLLRFLFVKHTLSGLRGKANQRVRRHLRRALSVKATVN